MRQQIRNGRIERKHNQDQLFMYYKCPKIDWETEHIYQNVQANSGQIAKNNPQRYTVEVYERWSPLRGYYKVCSSLENRSQRVQKLPKVKIRPSFSKIEQEQQVQAFGNEQILAERARQFINRIRKQREYDHGKALIRKKKEEQNRRSRQKQEDKLKENYSRFVKEHRLNKLTDSILFHQERICQRLRNSISRYHLSSLRSKTEEISHSSKDKINESQKNAQFQQMDQAESKLSYSPVIDFKNRYKN